MLEGDSVKRKSSSTERKIEQLIKMKLNKPEKERKQNKSNNNKKETKKKQRERNKKKKRREVY